MVLVRHADPRSLFAVGQVECDPGRLVPSGARREKVQRGVVSALLLAVVVAVGVDDATHLPDGGAGGTSTAGAPSHRETPLCC
ncbi:hypothetical protein [Umezawaea sp.]|uniref:hypothetical protein n=1 Tax=Umezawaea sp. TaxID=1955258 RepID=UPI002ED1DD86